MKPIARMVTQLEASCGFNKAAYGDGKGGAFDFSSQATILNISLSAAVPLWYLEIEAELKVLGEEEFHRVISQRATRCSNYVAEHGDALMFRVKGKSAEAFNRLAEGIACLAFCPGGVIAFGTHWERNRVRVPVV